MLPKLQPGPQIGAIQKELLEWQISNPQATAADARQWVMKNYEELL